MAASSKYTLFAVNVNGTLVSGVQSVDYDMGLGEITLSGDGSVDPTFTMLASQVPMIGFRTTQVSAVLNAVWPNGFGITGGNFFRTWLQRAAEGGTRTSGAAHIKAEVSEGIIVPRSLSARLNGVATIDAAVHATYDGTNAPIVFTASSALSGTPAVSKAFIPGPIKINGTTITQIESFGIEFGFSLFKQHDNDAKGYWPTMVAIKERRPSIRFTTHDMAALTTLGLSGAAQGATDSLFYLRGMQQGTVTYADDQSQHIKCSLDEGSIRVAGINANHPDGAMASVIVTPVWDGTNDPLAFSYDTAIT